MSVSDNQKGFTLVELIVAMAIFSMAITLISISFVGLIKIQRNVTADRETQRNARRAMEELIREIRSTNDLSVCPNGTLFLSQGSSGRAYYTKSVSPGAPKGLYRSPAVDCTEIDTGNEVAVTSKDVNVRVFNITQVQGVKLGADIKLEMSAAKSSEVTILEGAATTRGVPGGEGEDLE